MIADAIAHRGFSYLHILSPCVTFDKTSMTYKNLGGAVRDLPANHDSSDLMAAMAQAMDPSGAGTDSHGRTDHPKKALTSEG